MKMGWMVACCLFVIGCSADQDLSFQSDGDMDMDGDSENSEADGMQGEGSPVAVSFQVSGVDLAARITQIAFLDANGQTLSSATGDVALGMGESNEAMIPMPEQFSGLDVSFGRFDLQPGGGDGEGGITTMLLPHFVIDRDGGDWNDVTVEISIDNYRQADTAEERRLLLKKVLDGLTVLENGEVVGHGNYEKTMALLDPKGWVIEKERDVMVSPENLYEYTDENTGTTWLASDVPIGASEAAVFCDNLGVRIATLLDWAYMLEMSEPNNTFEPNLLFSRNPFWLPEMMTLNTYTAEIQEPALEAYILCVLEGPDNIFTSEYAPDLLGLNRQQTDKVLYYEDAIDYCENATFLGVTGWRLPTLKESAFINLSTTTVEEPHWTADAFLFNDTQAWAWENEEWKNIDKLTELGVVCVRALP